MSFLTIAWSGPGGRRRAGPSPHRGLARFSEAMSDGVQLARHWAGRSGSVGLAAGVAAADGDVVDGGRGLGGVGENSRGRHAATGGVAVAAVPLQLAPVVDAAYEESPRVAP